MTINKEQLINMIERVIWMSDNAYGHHNIGPEEALAGYLLCLEVLNDYRLKNGTDMETAILHGKIRTGISTAKEHMTTVQGRSQRESVDDMVGFDEPVIDMTKDFDMKDIMVSVIDNGDTITATKGDQTRTYNGVQLAKCWLTMSNDEFYEKFGFNWVPSNNLQVMARVSLAGTQTMGTWGRN
jgi:hypothetical protein